MLLMQNQNSIYQNLLILQHYEKINTSNTRSLMVSRYYVDGSDICARSSMVAVNRRRRMPSDRTHHHQSIRELVTNQQYDNRNQHRDSKFPNH